METRTTIKTDSNGTVVISYDGKEYDANSLAVAIAKSPTVKADAAMEFASTGFVQSQFSPEFLAKFKKPVVTLMHGKHVVIVNPNGVDPKSFTEMVLVAGFALKKAKYQSPEEIDQINRENEIDRERTRQEQRDSPRHGYPDRFSNRPRFSGRGR